MEQNTDYQLSELLREWEVPPHSQLLELLALRSQPSGWRFLLHGSIRVPVPVACCFMCCLLLMVALAWWSTRGSAEYVRTPVQVSRHDVTFRELQPVSVLRPRIVRGRNAQN